MRRLAVGVAIALLTAACGGGGTSATVTLVRDAPKRTTAAGTARMEVLVEQLGDNLPGGPPPAPVKIDGEADFAAHRGHMLIDLTQYGLQQPVDAVFDNATVYEKFPPALLPALPSGKSWVKVDLATAGQNVGVPATGVGQAPTSDPSQTLDYLRGASGNAKKLGADQLRGTPTTKYRVTVDLNKAAAASPANESIKSTIKLLGSSTQPVDVWLDAQGRVRRMQYTVDLSKSKASTTVGAFSGSVRFTLELFDFGVPVQAAVPPLDQVADLSSLSGGK